MPELPEVETITRVIEPQIRKLQINHISVYRPEIIAHPGAEDFCRRLTGQIFDHMERRGKYLIIALKSGDRIILHLRMTGRLLITPADCPIEKHTHLVIRMSNDRELHFCDTRRFGRFWLLASGETDTYSGIEKLGIEPLSANLSAEHLYNQLGKRKKSIKECLMDQSVIAGIGNIYSDEILFTSKIYPACPACSLTWEEWSRLAEVIPQCLSFFIRKNAITPEEYFQTNGQEYRNTPFLQVYGHENEPCPFCKTPLRRIVIGGRSSTFCPCCQKSTIIA